MHYSTLIITTEKPTEDDIERVLEPFNEDNYYYNAQERGVNFESDEVDPERPLFLWDWYVIGGRWKNRLKCSQTIGDIAPIDKITNLDEVSACYCIDDTEGIVIAREHWNGNSFVEDEEYDNKLTEIKERSKGKGYYMTVVDIHD